MSTAKSWYGNPKHVSIQCAYCKKEFTVAFNHRKRKYCSAACVHEAIKKPVGLCDCGNPATNHYIDDWECDRCRDLRLAFYQSKLNPDIVAQRQKEDYGDLIRQ